MNSLTLTQHAPTRMAQRGFRISDLELISLFGADTGDGYIVRTKDCQELESTLGVPARKPQKARGNGKTKDADTIALEKRVSDALGLAVTVNHRDPGGSVQISYRSLEQLDEVMRRLARGS
jgi:hypothetical protein